MIMRKSVLRESPPETPFPREGKPILEQHHERYLALFPMAKVTYNDLLDDLVHFCWAKTHIQVNVVFLFHHPLHNSLLI